MELLKTWKEYEEQHGDEADLKAVEAMMTWQTTSLRKIDGEEEHETCEYEYRLLTFRFFLSPRLWLLIVALPLILPPTIIMSLPFSNSVAGISTYLLHPY